MTTAPVDPRRRCFDSLALALALALALWEGGGLWVVMVVLSMVMCMCMFVWESAAWMRPAGGMFHLQYQSASSQMGRNNSVS